LICSGFVVQLVPACTVAQQLARFRLTRCCRAVLLLFAPNIIHGKLEVLSGMETPAMRRLQLGSCEASLFYSTATAAAVYGADGEKSKRRQ